VIRTEPAAGQNVEADTPVLVVISEGSGAEDPTSTTDPSDTSTTEQQDTTTTTEQPEN